MFSKTLTWSAAMGWHLWRIATLRPAFNRLSDSGIMVASFVGLFYAAGVLRWTVLGPGTPEYEFWPTMLKLFAHMVVVFALFERRSRNSALTSCVLGVSAVFDLAVAMLCLLGLRASVMPVHAVEVVMELAWMVAMAAHFSNEPPVVRANGYRRSLASSHPAA